MDPNVTPSRRSSSSNSDASSPHSTKTSSSSAGKKRPREEYTIPTTPEQPAQDREKMNNRITDPLPKTQGAVNSVSEPEAVSRSTTPTGNPPTAEKQPGKGKEKEKCDSTEGLLVPLASFNWTAFMTRCQAELKDVEGEEAALLAEYHRWEWIHELWSTCRSQSETLRLSREIATITEWTKLKENELENARVQHTDDMAKISSVLGLVTSSPLGKRTGQ